MCQAVDRGWWKWRFGFSVHQKSFIRDQIPFHQVSGVGICRGLHLCYLQSHTTIDIKLNVKKQVEDLNKAAKFSNGTLKVNQQEASFRTALFNMENPAWHPAQKKRKEK